MKKTVAILLLCCFALYHFGYYAFYFSYTIQMEVHWSKKIFNEYGTLEERTMKIPIALPYLADQEEFQVINTSFEKNGQHYRAIKQRYANDTLQVIYVSDNAKKNLDLTLKQWIGSLVQDEVPDQSSNHLLGKIFIKDYSQPDNRFHFSLFPGLERQYIGFVFLPFEDVFPSLDSPPPQCS